MTGIRVLLADDHAVVRAGLRALLDAHPDLTVVAEAEDGPQAVRAAVDRRPDVAVLDYKMPGMTGAEVAGALAREAPGVRPLVLTAYEDRAFLRHVLQAGARGYVLKHAAAEELVQAVRVVAGGGVYVDPALAGYLVEGFVGGPPEAGDGHHLSGREEEVLRLIARGYANKEVAARLQVSVKTVETYKTRAMEKLGLSSRVDVIRHALRTGWLERE